MKKIKLEKIMKNNYIAILFITFAVNINLYANHLIGKHFPDRPVISDSLFLYIPHIKFTEYLIDIIPAITVTYLIIETFYKKTIKLTNVLYTIGFFYLLRGIGTILNPLARPTGIDYSFGFSIFHDKQLGMWPSGHIGFVVLCLLFSKNKKLMWTGLIIQIFALISSRGHYSIDVYGGIVIALISYIAIEKVNNYISKHKSFKLNDLNRQKGIIQNSITLNNKKQEPEVETV